jgi:hypothetical protein
VALTSDNQPTGYVASASTSNSADYNAYKAFNNTYESDTTSGWASASLTFSSQVPSGTAASFNGDSGEHLTIQLPNKIKLETHHLFGRQDIRTNEFPVSAKLYASNDNNFTTFELIESYEDLGQPSSSTEAQVHNINETRYFQYYRLMVTKISGTQGYACVGEWELYGTPEYDPEAHGTDVTVKSVANVPNTDWLEVYYDAKNYTNGLVQDLSTNSFNGTLTNGASYNNSDGIDKFVFDAGLNQYMTTTTNISGSAFIHTTSMWVKFVEVSTDSNDQHYLFMLGAFGSNSIGMYYSANQGIRVYVPGFDYRTQYHPVAGKWFHVSYTYAGGAHGTAAMNAAVKFYINGKQWNIPAYYGGTSTVTLPSSSVLQINGSAGNNNTLMDMEVANFRLFNRALTTDEIYQLYAYQKEDFGHGDLSMTLKAGRLGIGTSEPLAALDVRGDIFGRGIIQVQSTTFNGITSGNSNSFTTLPGLTTKITPKRPGSKILVLLNLFWSAGTDAYFQGNVKKDGTVLVKQEGSVGSASKTSFATYNYDRAIYCLGNIGFSYLDDSNIGTQPIEYTVEVRNRYSGSQSWYINYTSNTADANRLTGVSTLTLLEIQQ